MLHDVFICHASEDKDDFVRPLAILLEQQHVDVWYDEFSLNIGDSLRQKIDEGLAQSRYGIVVLSKSFFKKPWAKRELAGLVAREMTGEHNLILPIWHRVTVKEVVEFSPPMADKMAVSSADGINAVIRAITKKIRPDPSPLIVAKDHLISFGISPPPISDEWWLDIIEDKEFLKYPDINSRKRWIFPLPYQDEDRGRERGINIASAALQMDWSFEGEELDIGPTTHPEVVHDYLRRWPGLFECARENPEILALYVPQLTIPGFDAGFEDVFDQLLQAGINESKTARPASSYKTLDGRFPLCPDIIAFRHPSLGNYTYERLAYKYFYAHDLRYMRSFIDAFEGLVWLLSDHSNWLPTKYREILLTGIKKSDKWVQDCSGTHDNTFFTALMMQSREKFNLTKPIKMGLKSLIDEALNNLSIDDKSSVIIERLLESNIISSYYDYFESAKKRRSKS
jgi:hypothetical protein